MEVLDPGHHYTLKHIDGDSVEYLRFVKREGPGYPGNEGHYAGTNLQEVLRVLIDRIKYLDNQIPDQINADIIENLRFALEDLETRAAQRHGYDLKQLWRLIDTQDAETLPTCNHCGHILCERMNVSKT